jgi:two-component system chemotaxis response regulator CheY
MNTKLKTKRIGKVLIVDDCARMRQEIRSMLDDLVEAIFEAEDGRAAIAAYFLHKPDWVTMDLDMHPVDGLTALREIKARDPLARILIVTAHGMKSFREAARLAGASGYLLKDNLENIRDAIGSPGGSVDAARK